MEVESGGEDGLDIITPGVYEMVRGVEEGRWWKGKEGKRCRCAYDMAHCCFRVNNSLALPLPLLPLSPLLIDPRT